MIVAGTTALSSALGTACGGAGTAFASASEGAGEGIAGDWQEVGHREEAEFAAEEGFFGGGDVEFADQSLDEEDIDWSAHDEDAVGAWFRDDLRRIVFAGTAVAAGHGSGGRVRGGRCSGGALDASGFLGALLGGEQGGEGLRDFRDIGVLHLDETRGDFGGRFIDFFFEVDEFADQRGVFGDDDGGGIGGGRDGTEGTELADDLGERVDGFGGFEVAEGHHVGDHGIAFGQLIIIFEGADTDSRGAGATSGEGENIEFGVVGMGDKHEVFEDGCFFEELGGLGEGEGVFGARFLDE